MAQPAWELDPIQGRIYTLIDGQRSEATDTVNIGGTDFAVSGGRLVDTSNPFNQYQLGMQGSSYLTQLERGDYMLSNQIRFEGLNAYSSPRVQQGYSGDVSVQFSTGEVRTVSIPFLAVAPQGGRIFKWRPSSTAEWRYESTTYDTLEALAASVGVLPDLQWATSLDVALRAVGRALLRDSERLILDYARDQGLYKDNGDPDFSGAFHMLLDAASISTDVARSARIIPGG